MSMPPVPGKSCGSCMLCCKLLSIKELAKAAGAWCKHAKPGAGCSIYEARPDVCQTYYCDWMTNSELGPEWHPAVSTFIIHRLENGSLTIETDPGYPAAWRKEPYYSMLKRNAVRLLEQSRMLLIKQGPKTLVVLPDREESFHVPPGYMITIHRDRAPGVVRYSATVDPVGMRSVAM